MTGWLRKPLPAALLLTVLWTVWRLVYLAHDGIPDPAIHDEFSYILGADTFAHGRLANPPHPLGKFFESPHILLRPTYASKYPPGQALFLALGQRLFGSPFYGVLLGSALAVFTFCMMLYAWVPHAWALAVSGMVAACLQPPMYWANSYWGGAVAASGGALVLLGIGMSRKTQTPLAGISFASGALLLFWTRPVEGGVFTITLLVVFARELWRTRRMGAAGAALLVLALGGAWTCYYNKSVTGSPFRLPYVLHQSQYDVAPVFWFLPLREEPAYSHPRLASAHGANGWESLEYRADRSWPRGVWLNFFTALRKFGNPLGTAVLFTLLIPVAWSDTRFRKMAIAAGAVVLTVAFETWHLEHYAAPGWAALALMIAIWAERAWNLWIYKLAIGPVFVAMALLAAPAGRGTPSEYHEWGARRTALVERLSGLDRPQLVIVQYPAPDWKINHEWVYNGAEIDGQRVVFAHDLGMEKNRALLDYYRDRQANLLTFDAVSGLDRIEPYPASSQ
jgi:hypothetical protein